MISLTKCEHSFVPVVPWVVRLQRLNLHHCLRRYRHQRYPGNKKNQFQHFIKYLEFHF